MIDSSLIQLGIQQHTIAQHCNCSPRPREFESVKEKADGKSVWEGVVHIFDNEIVLRP